MWSCQKTPRFWGDRAKRLLSATAESAPRTFLAKSPQQQGVFWLNPKSQNSNFKSAFLGLNIALSPNLIGSSDADFHKDSESGLNWTMKNTKESFVQTTADLIVLSSSKQIIFHPNQLQNLKKHRKLSIYNFLAQSRENGDRENASDFRQLKTWREEIGAIINQCTSRQKCRARSVSE